MWQQLKVQIKSDDSASLEQQMLERGALSVSYLDAENQPVFQEEPGVTLLWDDTFMLCLFDDKTDLSDTLAMLRSNSLVKNSEDLAIETFEDREWERCWMADFHPMRFGEKLWICPSWETPPNPDAVTVTLDPGLAFGSGSHATTALCLRWLEQASLQGSEVIDYGCGSGVLAITAALLGARRVHAVDHDPQAIAATRDNSDRNNIRQGIITACLPEALPQIQADMLVANILAEPLLNLSVRLSRLVRPGGSIVLSGLLQEQIPSLTACYQRWFDMAEPVSEQQWILLTGRRKA